LSLLILIIPFINQDKQSYLSKKIILAVFISTEELKRIFEEEIEEEVKIEEKEEDSDSDSIFN